MQFKNAFIVTHSPQQVAAVVSEIERLGYRVDFKFNYRQVAGVAMFSDGGVSLISKIRAARTIMCLTAAGNLEIKQIRHLRRDLCTPNKTLSQDGNAVLYVVEKPVWAKPSAYSPIVTWVVKKAAPLVAVVKRVFNFLRGK